jgi:hypothetical protein
MARGWAVRLGVVLAIVTVNSALAAQQPRAGTARAGARGEGAVLRMKLVRIMDAQGWGQPVEVARILVPTDWKTEGGVTWAQGMTRCPQNIIQARWRAVAPDGLTGFEILPQYSWVWSDDPMQQQLLQQSAAGGTACDAAPVLSPPDFLGRMVVPRVRQGARILGAEPLRNLAGAEQQKLMASYGVLVQQGYLRGVRAEAGRVRMEHAIGGRPVEEWMSATIATVAAPSANSAALMQGGVAMTASNFTLMAYNVIGTWAPKGQLDQHAKLFATMLASLRPNPQYQAAVGQWLANMTNIQRQGAMDRHRIWREAQDYISNSIRETYAQNQAVQDRMAEQWGQAIRGVETYVDPRTNERVELVGGYTNAWTNGKGEYLLVDRPNFNPAIAFQEDWRALKRPER